MQGCGYHHKWPLSALLPAPPRANPIASLIGRCDTMKRFQGRFHAPAPSVTPRGDPARVRNVFPACLIHTEPNQPNQSTNYPIRTHGWAPLLQTVSRKWTKTRPNVTDKEQRALQKNASRARRFRAQRETRATRTCVITADCKAEMRLLALLSSLLCTLPILSLSHPSFTLWELALGTHLYGFRHAIHVFIASCPEDRRSVTLWDWTRPTNTNIWRDSPPVGDQTESN